MGKYIYVEIGLTMLQFLLLEEFIEDIKDSRDIQKLKDEPDLERTTRAATGK